VPISRVKEIGLRQIVFVVACRFLFERKFRLFVFEFTVELGQVGAIEIGRCTLRFDRHVEDIGRLITVRSGSDLVSGN